MPSTGIPFPNIDPVLIHIGPLAIRWYALAYIAGIVIGWRYILKMIDTPRLWTGAPPVTKLQIDDALLCAALGVILGGRIGYVLVYDSVDYIAHPLEIFAVWHGGMSFHGGAFGVLIGLAVFAWRNGIPMLSLFDLASAAAPIGSFFGRIANFINGELWGRPTDMPWGVIFPTGGPMPRHPSQIYQACLEGLLLFVILRVLTHYFDALKRPGTVWGAFIAGYGVMRIAAEHFREPDAQLGYLYGGWLTMGMLLSIPMVVVGLLIVWQAPRLAALGTPAVAAKRK
ncbi:MAG: prolipoprotein diacylglyceryl transferase [Parvibaculum sp.]|uniref:prolipoprotein diacylglyceryl transferase n=1 Tax=Parvibaculum sp. TaxID=2024848 RepID=UPI0025FB3AB0|nr:prolipoprotein diacylglyceryl transferase [Parvibaculum sp.]MCE9649466.1 prolipoprotein diacylglyceryl transferase [Parvibaculum sp.]